MYQKLCIFFLLITISQSQYFLNHVNHMEYYKNRTRPSKAFSSFSTNYLNQNSLRGRKVQCGTRTVDFTARTGKIVGGTETPYGAFPWQVSGISFLDLRNVWLNEMIYGVMLFSLLCIVYMYTSMIVNY